MLKAVAYRFVRMLERALPAQSINFDPHQPTMPRLIVHGFTISLEGYSAGPQL